MTLRETFHQAPELYDPVRLSCITRLIDERHGGRVTKRYMNELAVAYRS